MKRGKQTCRILKEIRKQIAEANDIEFITSECQYQGDCLGTCPKCEAEVRYLEQQLEYKRLAGKAITILGISASVIAMGIPLGSCTHTTQQTSNASTTSKEISQEIVTQEEVDTSSTDVLEESAQKQTIDAYTKEKKVKEISPEIKISGTTISGEVHPSDSLRHTIIETDFLENDTLDMVEQMPTFPGGQEKLMTFIGKTIDYGPVYQGNGTQGRVIVKFIVDKEGNVVNPQIARGIDPFLDKEALRVVKLMPKWNPGVHKGKKVAVWFTVPVMFRLQ